MLKRLFWTAAALVILLAGAFSTAAQDSQPLDWIPSNFSGLMRLRVDRGGDTLLGLNMAAFVGSFLQPTRYTFEPFNSLDALIPLTPLDIENASFDRDILPWLGDEILLAYEQFGDDLRVDDTDLLFILPTTDALQAAASLNRVIQGQDLLERRTYRDVTLYVADRATFAFTPRAVIIGQTARVEAVIDLQAGEGISLIDEPSYRALAPHLPQDALLTAYIKGDDAQRALSMLVSGSDDSLPLIMALGEALSAKRGEATFEQAVLGSSLEGVGVSVQPDTLRLNSVRATLTLYDSDEPEVVTVSAFNPAVLDLIPQNAMVVHTGTDAVGAVYDVLYTLPLTNFIGELLGAFPVDVTIAAENDLIAEPTADNIEAVVSSFLDALNRVARFDLQDDLLQYLSGSYAVAVMPRPNNPSPLNTLYDVLVIAQVSDAEAALKGLTDAAQAVLNLDALESVEFGDFTFQVIPSAFNDEPAVSMGTADDMLIVGTGASVEAALNARRGDNRLVSRPRWQSVSENAIPHLYLDIPPIYNTFFPRQGAPTFTALNQLGAHTTYLGEGVFQVQVLVTLPGGL